MVNNLKEVNIDEAAERFNEDSDEGSSEDSSFEDRFSQMASLDAEVKDQKPEHDSAAILYSSKGEKCTDNPSGEDVNENINRHPSTSLNQLLQSVRDFIGVFKEGAVEHAIKMVAPTIGILLFLMLWAVSASQIETSLGTLPGPAVVMEQYGNLYQEHTTEREKEALFFERQYARIEKRLEDDPSYVPKVRAYTGKETFLDQIVTSIVTVLSGFILATCIAVPLGVLVGLNQTVNRAVNPIIQLLKPISPLAWLPLVTLIISALYTTNDPLVEKSFLNSMMTVTLCCIWPMVINTSVGVGSVSQDLINVSRVINLKPLTHIRKIVLPTAIPYIFTGMRLSIGIAWMVLIAAEMLAQNPGLGKFVWDEFQNGSSDSLGRIMAAVIVIGMIGFLLDKMIMLLQNTLSWQKIKTG